MAVLLSGTTIGGHVAVHANNISTYALTSVPANVITTSGGQTIAGITYFSNVESLNLYGIRGRFTNEYIHLYEKVGIGHPGGWGQGEANTPTQGLSIYGGINIAYARDNGATINTYTRINKNWAGGDYGAEQFTIRGTYPSIALRSTQHNSKWLIHHASELQFYYGGTVDDNNWANKFSIPTDGNIWMAWANANISTLLDAKQNASTAITTSNIGSQSVNYATSAGNADTVDGYHATNAAGGLAVINANGYWYPPSWINVGGAGIYSGTNNAHLLPNNTSPHGAWEMIGSKGGWSGIYFRDSGNTLMANANDSGFYNANAGWQIEWYNGTLSVSKQANGGGTLATVLDSSNFTSWAQTKVYQGQNDGDWQNFTNDVGEFRVDEVLNITSGNHSNYPTGVYTYGGVMSWRGNNHSFQLYASHTGDLTFKTQWGNDNYSGWRNIIHSANIGSQSVSYATTAGALSSMNISQFTNNSGYITSGDTTIGIYTSFLGSGSTNISSGYSRVIRNENGEGGNLPYAPVLHLAASDTMWQIAGGHAGSTNLQWRSGYAGTWSTPWWTILHSGNYTSYSPSLTGSGASGSWAISITGNSATVGGRSVGNEKGNVGYFDSNGNLYINNPESYSGEVRLGAAWERGGVYASGVLSLSTSSSQIDFVFSNSTRAFFASDGNLWMSWAGAYISTLLDAKQNASTAITTSNIGSQSVNYASSAGNADTVDSLHASSFVRNDTTGQYLRAYYQYGSYLTTERPIDLRNQMGGSGMRVDFMLGAGGGSWNHVITFSGYDAYNMYQLGGYYDGGSTTNLYVRSEANHGTTSWTAWRRLLNEVADPYAVNMNQYVRTTDAPTFAEVYNNGWFRTVGHQGLYNPTNNAHFYPNNASYGSWRIDGSRNGWYGIHFDSGATLMMNGSETGVHREGVGWQWRWDAGTLHCHKGASGGGTDAIVLDSSNYNSYAPTLTGGNASGTWGINVTGSAGSASSSSRSSALDIVGYGSGNMTYYQTSGTFAGYSGWAGYFVSNHGDGATYYNQTIIMPFWGPPQYSRLQGGTFAGPYTFWSTENLNDYAPNMNQYVRTTDNVTFNTTTSPTILVNNHSDNTKGYRIHNTSGSSVSAMFVNSSNQLVIAAGAVDQVNLNKKVYVNGVALGVNVAPSGTAGRIDASNDIVAYSSSDERLKHNITPIENALDKVKSLTGVEFDWKPEYKNAHGYEGHDTGIIAQQVEAVMPSAVRTNDTGFLAVRYEKLIGLLIEGMKEQQAQIDELKAKLDGLTK